MEQGLALLSGEGCLSDLTVALTPSSPSSASEHFFFPSREPAGRGEDGVEAQAGGEGAAWAFCECTHGVEGGGWGTLGLLCCKELCPVSKNKAKEGAPGRPLSPRSGSLPPGHGWCWSME